MRNNAAKVSIVTYAILLSVVVALLAVDSRSLWIDEFYTWVLARQENISDWWATYSSTTGSDRMMPFFHFVMYFWSKGFGLSEFAIRFYNISWLLIGCIAIALAPFSYRVRIIWLTVIGLHPFIWYYLNEARPYILWYSGCALVMVAFIRFVKDEQPIAQNLKVNIALYASGATLTIAGSLLGALWLIFNGAIILVILRNHFVELKKAILSIWPFIAACVALSIIMTFLSIQGFLNGARASNSTGFSISAMGYGFLELLGAAGLGPGRNDMREGLSGVSSLQLTEMITLGFIGGALVLSAFSRLKAKFKWIVCIAVLGPVIAMMALGYILHWQIIGRHLLPLLLPVSLAYAKEIDLLIKIRSGRTVIVGLFAIGFLASTAMIRLSIRHQKDDYADAAKYIRPLIAQTKIVWWNADALGAMYYGLVSPQTKKILIIIQNQHTLTELPNPDVIVYSKKDIFDAGGLVERFIRINRMSEVASYPGFKIFAR